MAYELVFDAIQAGYRLWYFALFGMPFILLGMAGIRSSRANPPDSPSWYQQLFPYFITIFAAFWMLTVSFGTYHNYKSLSNAFENGECSIAERTITKYETALRCSGRGGVEELCINSLCFCLRKPGFDLPSNYISPVRVGKNVRIHHCNRNIARLEVSN